MKLSILVPTIPGRQYTFLPKILSQLEEQCRGQEVEVLCLYDNKKMSVGEKRNRLMSLASGKYITFIDDDDRVAEDYVSSIIEAIDNNPKTDCIVFDCVCTQNNKFRQHCKYGVELNPSRYDAVNWTGKPAHTMVWRRTLATSEAFPERNFGEDSDWVSRAWPKIVYQTRIDKVLYYYDFNNRTSATRGDVLVEPVKVSVVMSTFCKLEPLKRTLESIIRQRPPFKYEVIVVDDGTPGEGVWSLCAKLASHGHLVRSIRLDHPTYRNPGIARNVGMKAAFGEILVLQSDEVVHASLDVLEKLCNIREGTFNIATVWDAKVTDSSFQKIDLYTGVKNARPLFFLGAIRRKHVYAIGGNCEEFTEPGYEDDWFSKCLVQGLGLEPVFLDDAVGFHQAHPRKELFEEYTRMQEIYLRKLNAAMQGNGAWMGGPAWPYP